MLCAIIYFEGAHPPAQTNRPLFFGHQPIDGHHLHAFEEAKIFRNPNDGPESRAFSLVWINITTIAVTRNDYVLLLTNTLVVILHYTNQMEYGPKMKLIPAIGQLEETREAGLNVQRNLCL